MRYGEEIRRTAEQFLMLDDPALVTAVEVWDRATLVYRVTRAEGPQLAAQVLRCLHRELRLNLIR